MDNSLIFLFCIILILVVTFIFIFLYLILGFFNLGIEKEELITKILKNKHNICIDISPIPEQSSYNFNRKKINKLHVPNEVENKLNEHLSLALNKNSISRYFFNEKDENNKKNSSHIRDLLWVDGTDIKFLNKVPLDYKTKLPDHNIFLSKLYNNSIMEYYMLGVELAAYENRLLINIIQLNNNTENMYNVSDVIGFLRPIKYLHESGYSSLCVILPEEEEHSFKLFLKELNLLNITPKINFILIPAIELFSLGLFGMIFEQSEDLKIILQQKDFSFNLIKKDQFTYIELLSIINFYIANLGKVIVCNNTDKQYYNTFLEKETNK